MALTIAEFRTFVASHNQQSRVLDVEETAAFMTEMGPLSKILKEQDLDEKRLNRL